MGLFRRKQLTPDVIAVETGTREVVVLTAQKKAAARILRRALVAQSALEPDDRNSELEDVVLEVMIALALGPRAAAEVPVVPGRTS
jgi:hypothetical protein